MVNTELAGHTKRGKTYYNILNIVVNTEPPIFECEKSLDYNILNIVVNTELSLQDQISIIIITY